MGYIQLNPISPINAYFHAKEIAGKNAECEKIIINDPYWSYRYAKVILEARWFEAESIIATDPESAYGYALTVIEGCWRLE